jgi:hypothetical protein
MAAEPAAGNAPTLPERMAGAQSPDDQMERGSLAEAKPPASETPAAAADATASASDGIVLASAAPGYRVQLGSFRTPDGANRMIRMLSADHGDLLSDTTLIVREASIDDVQQVYRVVSDLLPNREAATTLCDALKGRSLGCLMLRSP